MNAYLDIFGDVLRIVTFQDRAPQSRQVFREPVSDALARRRAVLPGAGDAKGTRMPG